MRRIAIMIGSDSDLPQCQKGLEFLAQMVALGKVEVVEIITSSIHRNTEFVLKKVRHLAGRLSLSERIYGFFFRKSMPKCVDVLIVGAGWANHLTGTIDAYLRGLENDYIVVIGVAFEDKENVMHTVTAELSIKDVPGTQVVFDNFSGEAGFLEACRFAVEGKLPVIIIKEPKPPITRTLRQAMEAVQKTNLSFLDAASR